VDDCVEKAIEPDAPSPSKRLAALKELQQAGCRTFAMLCPVLPLADNMANRASAEEFVGKIKELVNIQACEQVWAEPTNEKGGTFDRVIAALQTAEQTALKASKQEEVVKLRHAIERFKAVKDDETWEDFARALFEALAHNLPPGRLRFLQYPTKRRLTGGLPGKLTVLFHSLNCRVNKRRRKPPLPKRLNSNASTVRQYIKPGKQFARSGPPKANQGAACSRPINCRTTLVQNTGTRNRHKGAA
jgi:hypothetical protein